MKIKEVIVVEGKSDYTFLKSFLDAEIITTNGSEISKETLDLIKKANEEYGIIVLTDPDYPGHRIRNIINAYVGECKNAFVDKKKSIKKNKVGVAESSKEEVLRALENVVTFKEENINNVSIVDLYNLGFIGKKESKERREMASEKYHLGFCNAKNFLKRINMFNISIEMLMEVIKK